MSFINCQVAGWKFFKLRCWRPSVRPCLKKPVEWKEVPWDQWIPRSLLALKVSLKLLSIFLIGPFRASCLFFRICPNLRICKIHLFDSCACVGLCLNTQEADVKYSYMYCRLNSFHLAGIPIKEINRTLQVQKWSFWNHQRYLKIK